MKKQTTKAVEKPQAKHSPFEAISENLPFHDFEKEPTFTGIYENRITLGEKEPFEVFIMVDIKTGERVFITKSHAIEKAIITAKAKYNTLIDVVFEFVFQGKTEVNGKPYNQFKTGCCTLEQYQDSL